MWGPRSKRIEVQHHCTREQVRKHVLLVKLDYLETSEQLVDMLTKQLQGIKSRQLRINVHGYEV